MAQAADEMQQLSAGLTTFDQDFFTVVDRYTEIADVWVHIEQEARHYYPAPEDSLFIRMGKAWKRLERFLRSSGGEIAHTIRKNKKEENRSLFRQRAIPYRNTMRYVYYSQHEVWSGVVQTCFAIVHYSIQSFQVELIRRLANEEVNLKCTGQFVDELEITLNELIQRMHARLTVTLSQAKEEWAEILGKVGTLEHSKALYTHEKNTRFRANELKKTDEIQTIWKTIIHARKEQLKDVLQLLQMKDAIQELGKGLTNEYTEFVEKTLFDPHKKLKSQLTHWHKQLSAATKSGRQAFLLSQKKEKVLQQLISEEIQASIQQVVDQKHFSKRLSEFASAVALQPNSHGELITLIKMEGFSNGVPVYAFNEINWQTFLRRLSGDIVVSALLPEKLTPEVHLQQLVEEYSQLLQIVETNLDVADEVDTEESETAPEILQKGIELALRKLDEITLNIEAITGLVATPFNQASQTFHGKVYELMLNQDVGEMKWADTQLKVKASAGNYKQRMAVLKSRIARQVRLLSRWLRTKFKKGYEISSQALGLSGGDHINVQKTNIATLLHDTERTLQTLPFIYRRLFDFKREVENTFFVKNLHSRNTTQKTLELWETGFPSSLAIMGEKGSGKTTLIRHLSAELFTSHPVLTVSFSQTLYTEAELLAVLAAQMKMEVPGSVQEFVTRINRRKTPTIVILENIQNCFLRHINGYDAINALLFLIAESRNKIFWVATCSRYAWGFLDVVVKISDYFSHSIAVDAQAGESIKQMIMRRQKASGYLITFKPDASTVRSRTYKRLVENEEELQAYLEHKFFEQLLKSAEGNATVALIYWIRAIHQLDDSQFVIELINFSGIEYLEELDNPSLFMLAAFVLHDILTTEELSMILRISHTSTQMMVSRLQARGLVVCNGVNFSLNDMVYRQVVRLLKTRNILNT